ncbi:MAG TPA: class I SAM-dependent methyltransferase [bacterium]|nr:class I SAM-dependent methyltransferase [bacterium]HPN29712.1 class I SAM-dependent methyltransferase [bacterium]
MNPKRKLWNEKFSDKKKYVYEPIAFIKNNCSILKKNRLLDIACGYGKNGVFLAENGFNVTGIDISDKALQVFRNEISARNLNIKLAQLEARGFAETLKPEIFDSILISRFKPDNFLINKIYDALTVDGIFMLVSFNLKHNEVNPQPNPEKCFLKEKEFIDSHPGLQIQIYEEFQFSGGFYNGYAFKKI